MTSIASRVSINYQNVMADSVGSEHGLTNEMLEELRPRLTEFHNQFHHQHGDGGQRWVNLPDDQQLADEIETFASEARSTYRNFILVGIGGSSLGAIATIQALGHPYRNLLPDDRRGGPRFFVLDNPDPEEVHATLDTVDLRHTLINVVTKSGQTAETMANFLVVRDALQDAVGVDEARKRIVATTDPSEGLLRALSDQEGYRTFPVPVGVDGRMTVLSAVGMLPAALCGIEVHGLLAGAAAMRARCMVEDLRTNPAYLLAAVSYLAERKRGKSMLVMMPYADALYGIADWFRQLWAESLGKRESFTGEEVFAGQTPINALGAIDQHSQIQLYTEGPNDKLICLTAVEQYRATVEVSETPENLPELAYLNGADLGTLLDRERLATTWALTLAQRPNLTISLPTIDAGILGELFFMHEMQTVAGGALYDVNPFGQPGVEAGKNATYALMGREGYDDLRNELKEAVATDPRYEVRPAD